MRRLILTALAAASLLPAAASAQSADELHRDRRDIREQQRELQDARRTGDRGDVREERRDVQGARQEYREDLRDRADHHADNRGDDRNREYGREDWRGWRDRNPGGYARSGWNAPFRYTAFRPGLRIAPLYFGTRYVIADPWRYHLPRARYGQQWVRHYNDVVLVDTRRGIVVDVIRGFYR